jgi:hypothetical protein
MNLPLMWRLLLWVLLTILFILSLFCFWTIWRSFRAETKRSYVCGMAARIETLCTGMDY